MTSTAITSDQIGHLKRAAIDAWMKGQKMPVVGTFSIVGGHYLLTAPSMSWNITRPGTDGEEGGSGASTTSVSAGPFSSPISTVTDVDYSSQFDAIRQTIDAILEPWLKLPDPEEVAEFVENCLAVSTRLTREASSSGESTNRGAGTTLDSCIREIEADSSDFQGTTARNFRAKFLFSIPGVTESYRSLSLTRGGAMLAQQKLWAATRTDATQLVSTSTSAMNSIVGSGDAQTKHTFELVGMALEGLKLFVPGVVAKGIDLAKLGIKAASSSLPTEADLGASTYEEAIGSLRAAFQTLSDHVAEEEGIITEAIAAHVESSQRPDQRLSYDLEVPALPEGSDITINQEMLRGLATTTLPALAVELGEIADLNAECSNYNVVRRSSAIGLGSLGPSREIDSFNQYIHGLLEELAAEVLDGAVSLNLVLDDFATTEAEIMQILNRYAAGVDQIAVDRPRVNPIDDYPTASPEVPYRPGYVPDESTQWWNPNFRKIMGDED